MLRSARDYCGCICEACDGKPHCHTEGDAPPDTPRTSERRWCVYGGIGCNVDHDAIARIYEAARPFAHPD